MDRKEHQKYDDEDEDGNYDDDEDKNRRSSRTNSKSFTRFLSRLFPFTIWISDCLRTFLWPDLIVGLHLGLYRIPQSIV